MPFPFYGIIWWSAKLRDFRDQSTWIEYPARLSIISGWLLRTHSKDQLTRVLSRNPGIIKYPDIKAHRSAERLRTLPVLPHALPPPVAGLIAVRRRRHRQRRRSLHQPPRRRPPLALSIRADVWAGAAPRLTAAGADRRGGAHRSGPARPTGQEWPWYAEPGLCHRRQVT